MICSIDVYSEASATPSIDGASFVDMDAGGIAFAPFRLELEVASPDDEPFAMIVVQPHRVACQSRQLRMLSRTSTPTLPPHD